MNPDKFKYGRESFASKQTNVESAQGKLRDSESEIADVIQALKEAGANNASADEILTLARKLKSIEDDTTALTSELEANQDRFTNFYQEMHYHALTEDALRDEMKVAIAENDWAKLREITERLIGLEINNTKPKPETYDLAGTKTLLERFATKYRYISGLFEGRAVVLLESGPATFIDAEGKQLPGEYKSAQPYSEGKAVVQLDSGKWVFIDTEGKQLPGKYKSAQPYSEGKAVVQLDSGRWAFIDAEGKQLPGEYKSARPYSEGKAVVLLESGSATFIDTEGKQLPGKYKSAQPYSEGKAVVQLDSGRWAFIDAEGKQLPGEYKWAKSYSEGKAFIFNNSGEVEDIDHNGKVITYKRYSNNDTV